MRHDSEPKCLAVAIRGSSKRGRRVGVWQPGPVAVRRGTPQAGSLAST